VSTLLLSPAQVPTWLVCLARSALVTYRRMAIGGALSLQGATCTPGYRRGLIPKGIGVKLVAILHLRFQAALYFLGLHLCGGLVSAVSRQITYALTHSPDRHGSSMGSSDPSPEQRRPFSTIPSSSALHMPAHTSGEAQGRNDSFLLHNSSPNDSFSRRGQNYCPFIDSPAH
jgi:hypothetical protein